MNATDTILKNKNVLIAGDRSKRKYFLLICLFSLLLPLVSQSQIKTMDINLENYEYPFPVKFIKLNIQKQQYQMAYMDVMPNKPNGKTILLFHGKNFNGAYWKQTANMLSENGYRVIIPDQIGFGKSSKPGFFQYSFQQLAANTKTLLDTLGIAKIAILGHSMGGMLAVRFVLMYPETITKLILENPIGLEDYKTKIPYQTLNVLYQKELSQNYATLKKYQLLFYYDNKWKPAYDEWLNINAGLTLNKNYPLVAWNNALTTDMIITQPIVYELENIKVPTLLIIGQRDRTALGKDLVLPEIRETMGNYPLLGTQTQKKIMNSELVKIDGIGHLPHIESFSQFIMPVLKFLEK